MHSRQHTHILCLSCQDLCRNFCQETCIPFLASPEDSVPVLDLTMCHSSLQYQTCNQPLRDTVIFLTLLKTKIQFVGLSRSNALHVNRNNDVRALDVHKKASVLTSCTYNHITHTHLGFDIACKQQKTSGPHKVLLQQFYPIVCLLGKTTKLKAVSIYTNKKLLHFLFSTAWQKRFANVLLCIFHSILPPHFDWICV